MTKMHQIKVLTLIVLPYLLLGKALFAEPTLSSPAAIRDMYPLTAIHYSSSPHSARLVGSNAISLTSSILWSNTNAIRQSYTVDAETREFRFSSRYGLSESTDIVFELPFLYRGGGVLDPTIDSWHDFWALPQGTRDRVADNSYDISGTNKGGDSFSLEPQGTGIGNIILGFSHNLIGNNYSHLIVNIDSRFSLPTSSESLGHSGIDSFIGLNSTLLINQWSLHSGLGLIYIGDNEVSRIRYSKNRGEGFLSLNYAFQSFSLFSSITATTEIVSNINGQPSYTSYLDFGSQLKLPKNSYLTLALREEMISGNGAQDISFFVELGTITDTTL